MNRREFITLLGSAAVWPLMARAEQAERMRRLGVLTPLPVDHPDAQARHTAFLKALTQLGWTDGRNLRIEARWSAAIPPSPANTRRNWPRSRRISSWQLPSMGEATTIGLDLAKHVFQLHGVDAEGPVRVAIWRLGSFWGVNPAIYSAPIERDV